MNKVVKPYMDDDGIFTMGRSASCEFGQFRLGVTESVLIGTKGYYEQQ